MAIEPLTRGKLITLLHSRAQGGCMDEMSLRELCRQAERMLRRDSAAPTSSGHATDANLAASHASARG